MIELECNTPTIWERTEGVKLPRDGECDGLKSLAGDNDLSCDGAGRKCPWCCAILLFQRERYPQEHYGFKEGEGCENCEVGCGPLMKAIEDGRL